MGHASNTAPTSETSARSGPNASSWKRNYAIKPRSSNHWNAQHDRDVLRVEEAESKETFEEEVKQKVGDMRDDQDSPRWLTRLGIVIIFLVLCILAAR